jgi:hypothetical protein
LAPAAIEAQRFAMPPRDAHGGAICCHGAL